MSTKSDTQKDLSRSQGLALIGAFLLAHAVALTLLPATASTEISYVFNLTATAFAIAACIRRYATAPSSVRLHWALFISALVIWGCGMARSGWEELILHSDISLANYADLIYFLYGVPVVLAISLPAQQNYIPLFFWLDVLQVTAAAVLTYLFLFTTLPFLGDVRPMPANLLVASYAVENITLALAAVLRLFSTPHGERRSFYRALNYFLWLYALCAIVNNQVSVWHNGVMGYVALVPTIPFLFFGAFALLPESSATASSSSSQPLAQFIDQASPVLFTLVLIALGLSVARPHFVFGAGAILLAAIAYALRVTVLQVRYMQSQKRLQAAHNQLETLSLTDALTGLANRRGFDLSLQQEWSRATRSNEPLALLMIDIDFFKQLNDRYGHTYGDESLRLIATTLRQSLHRSTDVAARYGGEEFAILLPTTGDTGAYETAQRIHRNVAALNIPHTASETGHVTISIGIATLQQGESQVSFLEAADQALYRAKEAGRNRIERSVVTVP